MRKTPEKPGFNANGRYRTRICDLCRVNERATDQKTNDLPSRFDTVAESLHQPLHLDADLPSLADALRDLLDADQRRRLAVELLSE